MSPLLRALFDHSTIGIGYRDLANMERVMAASGRDCLIVRPTTLTHAAATGGEGPSASGCCLASRAARSPTAWSRAL
jgi:hypothetical protein